MVITPWQRRSRLRKGNKKCPQEGTTGGGRLSPPVPGYGHAPGAPVPGPVCAAGWRHGPDAPDGEKLRLGPACACAMPRQRTDHSRRTYVFPDDLPERLMRFKEESGLSWGELARRLGTSVLNPRRWKDGVRPILRHQMALLELAQDLCLGHGRQGDQRPAADPGEQHRVDHHRDARLGHRRDRDPARHHGLRRRRGRLHGGRQEAVQPERVHRLRPDPIEQGDSAPPGGV